MFWPVIAATTLAFFAMVGFEDSVNMAEECRDPYTAFSKGAARRPVHHRRNLRAGVDLGDHAGSAGAARRSETPLLQVVQAGAPNFPLWIFGFITMFAVANSALINMLMASRLVYGMSREHVLPPVLGKVHADRRTPYIAIGFTTLLAFALITFVGEVPARSAEPPRCCCSACLRWSISSVLVLRKDRVAHEHFRTPTILPVLGAIPAHSWPGHGPDGRWFSTTSRAS